MYVYKISTGQCTFNEIIFCFKFILRRSTDTITVSKNSDRKNEAAMKYKKS